ncbi:DHA2 family efflux MFS transporter permease subunit [Pelosinus propionicus]|uniref:Drug resistance transporter, EmrB/QacA subfamily n=1 Tax=Pelosinus propionicus DSM 13327 TaxID=1123291 RepID=A0A1I4NU65_9FIRM|nr:DHA2 family efflux MFS transporter permease subunit [Pelosinus propionicus]SFM19064.1 drug resistance transporter, EmrB/QacA subfamily [Pelosinus propionicus DSM 13327]
MQIKMMEPADKWLALAVIILGTFMTMLDASIVNIAIPKLMSVFNVGLGEVKWVLTAYSLALAAIIPLTGFLIEIFGTKKVFIFALSMFTLGSMLCGLSWSNTSLVLFRIIQAIGGGMIMPVAVTIIFTVFPHEERGVAMGYWGIVGMFGPALGPTIGGYIIANMDWGMMFLVNVPLGILGLIIASYSLENSPTKPFKRFDIVGFISSVIGIVSLLYVLSEGASIDWDNIKNLVLLFVGLISTVVFIVNELTVKEPLLDLRVFKIYNYTVSQIVQTLHGLAFMGGVLILPLYLQEVRGFSALDAGLLLFPSAIAAGVSSAISGRLLVKVGLRILTVPGLFIVAVTTYQLSFLDMNTSVETILLLSTLRGLGMGFCMQPVGTAGIYAVPGHLVGRASALQNTIKQINQALCITVLTTQIQNHSLHSADRITEQASDILQQQAYNAALNYAMMLTLITILLSISAVMFMKDQKIIKARKA